MPTVHTAAARNAEPAAVTTPAIRRMPSGADAGAASSAASAPKPSRIAPNTSGMPLEAATVGSLGLLLVATQPVNFMANWFSTAPSPTLTEPANRIRNEAATVTPAAARLSTAPSTPRRFQPGGSGSSSRGCSGGGSAVVSGCRPGPRIVTGQSCHARPKCRVKWRARPYANVCGSGPVPIGGPRLARVTEEDRSPDRRAVLVRCLGPAGFLLALALFLFLPFAGASCGRDVGGPLHLC